jgi:hypothetical protein
MKLSQVLLLVTFALLFTGWLQAGTIHQSLCHLLNDNQETGQTTPKVPVAGVEFFTGTPNPDRIQPKRHCFCTADGDFACGPEDFSCWPSRRRPPAQVGGLSRPLTGLWLFRPAWLVAAHLIPEWNGEAITQLLLHTEVSKDALFAGGSFIAFSCDGGDAFDQCGFIITDPPGTFTIDIIFSGGHIAAASTTVPEPSTWMLFGTAACALLARKGFRRA